MGTLRFRQRPNGLNRHLSRQLLMIFGSFTGAVLVAGGLIGVVVYDTHRLILAQYREIEKTQEELLHAARLALLGELAGHFAHEVNNPAGIISSRAGYMQMKSRELPPEAFPDEAQRKEWEEDLEVIQEQAMRIGRFAHDLLDLARPRPLQLERVEIRALIVHVLDLLKEAFARRGVQVETMIQTSISLTADRVRLEQALVNLCKNALEAMPHGGKLSIRATATEDRVELILEDTGEGIPESIRDRIWQPFFTTKSQGSGLGLSIVRRIVELHGGTISIHNREEGGTRVRLDFPRAPERFPKEVHR